MLTSGPIKSPRVIIKFLKDPEISPEIKKVCIRLLRHPFLSQLFEKTPVSVIFEICTEYNKHPEIYDDIFSGKIKLYSDSMEKALPIVNYKELKNNCGIQTLFEPHTLIGQVVEKFAVCESEYRQIKRIAVKIKKNKMMTAAFNAENKIVSMIVDFVTAQSKGNELTKFVKTTDKKRIDLVKV